MKTDRLLTEKLENIKCKCQVLKMKEYITKSKDLKENSNLYVTRRFYDTEKDIYRPETLEHHGHGGKVKNP